MPCNGCLVPWAYTRFPGLRTNFNSYSLIVLFYQCHKYITKQTLMAKDPDLISLIKTKQLNSKITDQWLASTFILLQMHNYHHQRNKKVPFSVKYKVPCNECLVPWTCARFLLDLESTCAVLLSCRLCCIINIIIHHTTDFDDKPLKQQNRNLEHRNPLAYLLALTILSITI